jgi:choline dehydrogenase-like flavoprotein
MVKERVDVVVIGSGPAGAAVTKRLTDLGAKVLCLEQGDWVNPASYPSEQPNWETHLRSYFYPNLRRLPEDYPVTTAGELRAVQMANAVGGTSIHYTAHFPRFHPSDFRARSLDGVAADWPITYQDLEPYYDSNDREMGVSGLAGDPQNPPRSARPTPPLPLGVLGETIARGFNKLGWYWWPADNAIVSRVYDGRPACLWHGKCTLGCPIGSKSSADVTYWPKALRNGARLLTRCRVREITINPRGRVRGVLYYDRQGQLREQTARVVVLSCNGVGTPRLLLNSTSTLFPSGLGNSSGLVGRNFMMHATACLEGIFEERMDGYEGARGAVAMSQQFYETDATRGFVRGYTFQIARTYGPLHQAWGGITSTPVPWGPRHHEVMQERFAHVIPVIIQGEDLPEASNRVELDSDVSDSNGIPAPRVVYRNNENSRRLLDHGLRMGRELLKAAGAKDILASDVVVEASHLMGTARMGNDPRTSVVNARHQVHDVKNLFVVDGSSFVTSSSVNPTSTIGALALRAADGIWERRREWT